VEAKRWKKGVKKSNAKVDLTAFMVDLAFFKFILFFTLT
jgi:hypothetical protein